MAMKQAHDLLSLMELTLNIARLDEAHEQRRSQHIIYGELIALEPCASRRSSRSSWTTRRSKLMIDGELILIEPCARPQSSCSAYKQ